MIFLDANILLELLLPGRRKVLQVEKYLEEQTGQIFAISMLSVHLVWHFGRLAGIPDKYLASSLAEHEILACEPIDYAWALGNEEGKDFEDALQVAAALRGGCTELLTLDKALARAYASQDIKVVCL